MGDMVKLQSPTCADRIVNGATYRALTEEVQYLRFFHEQAMAEFAEASVVEQINAQYPNPIPRGYEYE